MPRCRRASGWIIMSVVLSAPISLATTRADARPAKPVCNGVVNAPGCQSYQRIPLFPVTSAPLKLGFVDDILYTRPGRYAFEKYTLKGAEPNTTYNVQLMAFLNSNFCEGPPFVQPSSSFTTNAGGNGGARIKAPGPTPGNPMGPPPLIALQNVVNTFKWNVLKGGVVQYASNCIPVFENPPTTKRTFFLGWPTPWVGVQMLKLLMTP
jgi:hypothetical protein